MPFDITHLQQARAIDGRVATSNARATVYQNAKITPVTGSGAVARLTITPGHKAKKRRSAVTAVVLSAS